MSKMKKLKKARFALPSLVTLGSVFCSFLAMAFVCDAMLKSGTAHYDYLFYAALMIIGSIVCDTFDGKVARKTHTSTKFGMELDSLADGVSFGIAPAFLMYGYVLHLAGVFGVIACFLYVSGTLIRLARFNIEAPEEGVQTFFKGLPAPGGAATIAAIVLASIHCQFDSFTTFELNTYAIITIAIGFLMVSTVKYKTFKGEKTPGDWIFVAVGLCFFTIMCFVKHPTIAFFLLVCYFIAFGMLNTVYMNLKAHPYGHRRHRHFAEKQTDGDNGETENVDHSDRQELDSQATDAKDSEPAAKKDSEPEPKTDSEPAANKDSEPAAKKDSEPEPKTDSEPAAKKDSEPAAKKDLEPEPQKDSEPEPQKDSEPEPKKDSEPEPKTDAEPEPHKDADPGIKDEKEDAEPADANMDGPDAPKEDIDAKPLDTIPETPAISDKFSEELMKLAASIEDDESTVPDLKEESGDSAASDESK